MKNNEEGYYICMNCSVDIEEEDIIREGALLKCPKCGSQNIEYIEDGDY